MKNLVLVALAVTALATSLPTGAFTNPPFLDIAIEGDRVIVITSPVSNTVGFAVTVVESSDAAGAAVTAWKPLDATGRTEFPMGSAALRFYRLSATVVSRWSLVVSR